MVEIGDHLPKIKCIFAKTRLFITKKRRFHRKCETVQRAVNGTRTRDPRLGKPMLYQLSHYRISPTKVIIFSLRAMLFFVNLQNLQPNLLQKFLYTNLANRDLFASLPQRQNRNSHGDDRQ